MKYLSFQGTKKLGTTKLQFWLISVLITVVWGRLRPKINFPTSRVRRSIGFSIHFSIMQYSEHGKISAPIWWRFRVKSFTRGFIKAIFRARGVFSPFGLFRQSTMLDFSASLHPASRSSHAVTSFSSPDKLGISSAGTIHSVTSLSVALLVLSFSRFVVSCGIVSRYSSKLS